MNDQNCSGAAIAHLILADANLPDLDVLMNNLPINAAVSFIHQGTDPLAQLAKATRVYQGLIGLHVLGHGEPGRMLLGDQWVDVASLVRGEGDMAVLAAALACDAHIWLYGCHSGQGREGEHWLDAWALATGATVHATDGIWQTKDASLRISDRADETTAVINPLQSSWQGSAWTHRLANTAPSFSTGTGTGKVTLDGGQQTGGVGPDGGGFLQQPDGKMVVAYTAGAGSNAFALLRLNPDGSIDTHFGVSGKARVPVGLSNADTAKSLILQADGKLVVAGYSAFGSFNKADFSVARLNADGSLDSSFGTGGTLSVDVTGAGVDDLAYSVVQQADGKLVLGGYSQISSGDSDFSLVRLNTDGSLDSSFGSAGKVLVPVGVDFDNGRTLTLQPDGKLVMAGQTSTDLSLIRLNADGSLDSSFGTGGKTTVSLPATNDNPANILVQSDGKLVVVGNSSSSSAHVSVIRLNADGTLDASFADAGVLIDNLLINGQAKSVIQQTDGKLVVAAQAQVPNGSFDIILLRLNADGSRDTSFGTDGVVNRSIRPESALGNNGSTNYSEVPFKVIQLADGKLAVVGPNDLGELGIFRINPDGSPDTTYGGSAVNTLGDTVAYAEGAPAVRLDSTVQVVDAELAALNNGLGDYSGAVLNVAIENGAPGDHVLFISAAGAGFSVVGNPNTMGSLQSGGQTFATFDSRGSQLSITFTGSGTPATQALVNDVASHITYANSHVIVPNLSVRWEFYDQNTGSQGSGGVLHATGFSAINATPVNTAPTITGIPGTPQSVTVGSAAALADFTVVDADGDNLTVTLTATNGTLGNLTDANSSTPGTQLTGTAASINAAIAGATFVASNAGAASIGISVSDGVVVSPTTGTYNLTATAAVVPVNTSPTFSTGVGTGKVVMPVGSRTDEAYSVIQQADGKLVLAGRVDVGTTDDFGLIRLNADGSLDTTFGADGKLILPIGTGDDVAYSVIQLANGKLVVAGYVTNGGTTEFGLVRLNADGSLDNSFGSNGKVLSTLGGTYSEAHSVIEQADGKLVVAGVVVVSGGGSYNFGLLRLNQDGSLDNSFGGTGTVNLELQGYDTGQTVIQQADGKLVVAGTSTSGGDFSLVRLNADGALDTTFSTDGKLIVPVGGAGDVGYSVIQQTDGKLVVAGLSDSNGYDYSLIRLNTDGTLDNSFGTGGKLIVPLGDGTDQAYSVVQQADGKLVVAGRSDSGVQGYDYGLIRLNTDGSLDTSFSGDGKLLIPLGTGHDEAHSLLVQADGKLVVAGHSANGVSLPDFSVARLNADGSLDTSFGGSIVSSVGSAVAYTEGGAPVLLDSSVEIFDAQLAALNSGAGNYSGSNFSISRQDGVNSLDILRISTSGASFTLSGGNLQSDGLTFGTITSNANGILSISFTGSGTVPTQALVNDVLSHITYVFGGSAPPASVDLEWSFSDGNSGSQGTGGALSVTSTSTVNITAVNSVPTLTGLPGTAQSVTPGSVAALANFMVADADGDNLAVTLIPINGSLGNLSDADVNNAGIQLSGSAVSINAALSGATFTAAARGLASIGISVSDGVAVSPTTGTYNLRAGSNTAPEILGLPTDAPFAVVAGTPAALLNFAVADVDGDNLTVTLTPTNGTLVPTPGTPRNLTDADPNTAGIQLTGTAASINAAIAGATFVASQAGAANIAISVSDGMAASPTTGTYSLVAVAAGPTNTVPTFQLGTGKAVVPVGPSADEAHSVIQQADGKLVVAGTSSNDFSLIRLNANGQLDLTFGTAGKLLVPVGADFDAAFSVIQQTDGKLVVAGYSSRGGPYDFSLIRLNANGQLDNTFGAEGKLLVPVGRFFDRALSVIQQTDGKLVVAGYSDNGNNDDFSLIRLDANGQLDNTFGTAGKLLVPVGTGFDGAFSVIQQTDGKLVVAGFGGNGVNSSCLIRLDTNGQLDNNFGTAGQLLLPLGPNGAYSVIQQADGKLVVAGGSSNDFSLIRLDAGGQLDNTFGTAGQLLVPVGTGFDRAFSVIQQTDGMLVVAGYSDNGNNNDFSLIRLDTSGQLDNTFGIAGKLLLPVGADRDEAYSVIQQADGKLVVAGISSETSGLNSDFSLIRLNTDGSLDTSFSGFATSTLGAIVGYREGAAAIRLDSTVEIFDAQLAALNSGAGNYSGASLTLARQGGASTQDVLGISTAGASFTVSGSKLQSGGQTFATFSSADGSLNISFTGSGTPPTQALVNDVLSHITYANSSRTPPASVTLGWSFSDGNSGSQGSGGALNATGTSTVNIAAINAAPTITGIPGTPQSVTVGSAAALADFTVVDADGDNLTVTLTATNGTLGNLTDVNSSLPGIQLTGTAASINTAIAGATFTATAAGDASISIQASDGILSNIGNYSFSAVVPPPANTAPTGAVTIRGTAQENQRLTATSTLVDADGFATITYQWFANGVAFREAVSFSRPDAVSSVVLTQAQVGKTMTVVATLTDVNGNVGSVTSAATAQVTDVNDFPTGEVTISGTAQENRTLTATSTLEDADGFGFITYQWFADGVSFEGPDRFPRADARSSVTLTQAQVGKNIIVVATLTDVNGNVGSVTSAATARVIDINDAPTTGAVTISGTAQQNQTLTAISTLVDADGFAGITYQWFANGVAFTDQVSFSRPDAVSSVVLTQAQVGKTITVVATLTDTAGNQGSVSSIATPRVADVNDVAIISGLSGTAQSVTAGAAAALDNFIVADADGDNLTVTLTAANGVLGNLTDANSNLPGIQLTGTAASINAAIAGATFTATAGGAASIRISVSDGVAASPTTGTYNLTALAPAPVLVLPSKEVENKVPAISAFGTSAVTGDGNGDGISDAAQAAVASVQFKLHTAVAPALNAGDAVFLTLVSGSKDGKANQSESKLTNIQQLDTPADIPGKMKTPLGLISFNADVAHAGDKESFSLYVDANLGVNGYWKKDAVGKWVNLASEPYGGQMVMEGGKLRLDFVIQDGGQFDADGQANGSIADPGAAGYMDLSITDHQPVTTHDAFWF